MVHPYKVIDESPQATTGYVVWNPKHKKYLAWIPKEKVPENLTPNPYTDNILRAKFFPSENDATMIEALRMVQGFIQEKCIPIPVNLHWSLPVIEVM